MVGTVSYHPPGSMDVPVEVQGCERGACERFYDDRYARGYMDDWPARKLERVRQAVAELGLRAAGTAVDFGCGNGVFTRVLAEALPSWRIVGVEISRTAVEQARRSVTGCAFHHVTECPIAPGSADLLFTHHVLEHVEDLGSTWSEMARLLGRGAHMLHVLPCGNAGSFEHNLCRLRSDGIDAGRAGRFFYEDEGHLRRLTTQQMIELAAPDGFNLVQAYYSHHRFEAIDWLSGNGVRFVRDLCDPGRAVDARARRTLKRLRLRLLLMAAVKSVARRRAAWLYPARLMADAACARWTARAEREWREMRCDSAGSEMYLVFHRGEADHV